MFYFRIFLGEKIMLRLRDLREDRDLNQSQIAEIINVSQVAYSYYELEKREIDLNSLKKLALFYNTSIDYIVGLTNTKEPYPRKK